MRSNSLRRSGSSAFISSGTSACSLRLRVTSPQQGNAERVREARDDDAYQVALSLIHAARQDVDLVAQRLRSFHHAGPRFGRHAGAGRERARDGERETPARLATSTEVTQDLSFCSIDGVDE